MCVLCSLCLQLLYVERQASFLFEYTDSIHLPVLRAPHNTHWCKLGVLRQHPYRCSGLATLPSMGAVP